MEILHKKIIDMLRRKDTQIDDYDLFSYGLKGFLNYALMLFIIYIISVILHTTYLTLVFTFSFLFLRTYCGGFHFEKKRICLLFSVLFLVLVPLIIVKGAIPRFITFLCFFSAFSIYKLSPIEHYNKPLSFNEKKFTKEKLEFTY